MSFRDRRHHHPHQDLKHQSTRNHSSINKAIHHRQQHSPQRCQEFVTLVGSFPHANAPSARSSVAQTTLSSIRRRTASSASIAQPHTSTTPRRSLQLRSPELQRKSQALHGRRILLGSESVHYLRLYQKLTRKTMMKMRLEKLILSRALEIMAPSSRVELYLITTGITTSRSLKAKRCMA